jgi:hypothetical protein
MKNLFQCKSREGELFQTVVNESFHGIKKDDREKMKREKKRKDEICHSPSFIRY